MQEKDGCGRKCGCGCGRGCGWLGWSQVKVGTGYLNRLLHYMPRYLACGFMVSLYSFPQSSRICRVNHRVSPSVVAMEVRLFIFPSKISSIIYLIFSSSFPVLL